jgi:signal transduction histidine kinase
MSLDSSYTAHDEIGNLSKGVNAMLARIDEQFQSLQQADKQRRELLTHLSHDLRTPLSSLHGFLEVINKPNSHLNEPEQRHYLNLAMDNCQQLKLTQGYSRNLRFYRDGRHRKIRAGAYKLNRKCHSAHTKWR